LVRLFTLWSEPVEEQQPPKYDRVEVPELSVRDMFDDAFTAIARDGAGVVEVAVRLQKAFGSLAASGDADILQAADYHRGLALKRSRMALDLSEDMQAVEDASNYATKPTESADRK
jgi:uncharacterized membrane protein